MRAPILEARVRSTIAECFKSSIPMSVTRSSFELKVTYSVVMRDCGAANCDRASHRGRCIIWALPNACDQLSRQISGSHGQA